MLAELLATTGTALGGPIAIGLLVPMEAGVPIPIPADLVMFAVGERVSAKAIPLWVAILSFEGIALVGTTALFLFCRGPGHAVVRRLGPRVGLSASRLDRLRSFLEHRGLPALVVGRATPGLRSATVIGAGVSHLHARRALAALFLGSSIFLQLHLVLGMLLGPLARRAFDNARAPALVALGAIALAASVFWLLRRGRRAGSLAWTEAACPACLSLGLVSEHVRELRSITREGEPLSHHRERGYEAESKRTGAGAFEHGEGS